MKMILVLTVLSCFVLSLAPAHAEISQRRLRREDDYTTPEPESPLDVFLTAIQAVEKPEDPRELRSDDDGQEAIENFVKTIETFGKNGRFRRTEEEDTEHHVDFLLGLINGRAVIKPKSEEQET
ncbi:hypothetical protein PRIC1_010323 [Phytophthora ramorum]